MNISRRGFVRSASIGSVAVLSSPVFNLLTETTENVKVLNPYNRAPVSLIIDDSTCLVNLAYYGIPQFAEVFPDQYKQDWRKLPREIPDSFVRQFGEWSHENGIKGKYSVVPYPACTGWLNRLIPGWTKQELLDSIALIRDLIVPNWDIHPEMVSHTRVIDIKTGKPYPDPTPLFMENWEWSQTKSADELAAYQAYALTILKEAGLPCEGLTTPGGYGERNQNNLAISTLQAVQDIYAAEIPHYFRDLYYEGNNSVAPRVLFPSDLDGTNPKCVVSVIGCTADWFGGWDGLTPGSPDKLITEDLHSGRLVDVIDSGEPAVIVCHWPGIYFNGDQVGFNILKEVLKRLNQKYDNLIWMKLSEIARYWAAKELTSLTLEETKLILRAPFSTPGFTLKLNFPLKNPRIKNEGDELKQPERVNDKKSLKSDSWIPEKTGTVLCLNLKKGLSEVYFSL